MVTLGNPFTEIQMEMPTKNAAESKQSQTILDPS